MKKLKTEKKPNVIFIVMDSLRKKNLSCYGYNRNTSPNIDSIANKGVLFEKAFSTNNSTNPSFLSILSGRHILKEDKNTFTYSKDEIKSFFDSGGSFLQEVLKKNGYKTYCLNYLLNWQKRGFDYFWKSDDEENEKDNDKKKSYFYKMIKDLIYYISSRPQFSFLFSKKIKREVRSEPIGEKATEDAIRIIKENKKNSFFMRIDFDDTHTPYNAPGEFAKKFIAEENGELLFKNLKKRNFNKRYQTILLSFFDRDIGINEVIAKYDSAIAYNDYLIGKIINTLEEEKLLDNTYIFLFSDHGESLTEHNTFFSHSGLYDSVMNVPLIIYGPRIEKNKKISSLVQLEDLMPSVLDLLKIEYSNLMFDGESLLPLIKGEKGKIRDSVFMEEIYDIKRRGLRTEKYKYIEINNLKNDKEKILRELYDLEFDPYENNNIAFENKDLSLEMREKMQNAIKELRNNNEKRRIKSLVLNRKIG